MIALGPLRQNVISIKPVGAFDLGRLARLHRTCFEDSWSRTDIARLLALSGGFGLLARIFDGSFGGLEGMRGVGFALCRVTSDESELLSIGVAPNFRRRHVAAALLRESMERCRREGAARMLLEVAVDNISAQRLYEAEGFEQVGMRADYYLHADGTRSSAYTMCCELKARMMLERAAAQAS